MHCLPAALFPARYKTDTPPIRGTAKMTPCRRTTAVSTKESIVRKPARNHTPLSTLAVIATLVVLPFAFSPVGGSGLPVFFAFH